MRAHMREAGVKVIALCGLSVVDGHKNGLFERSRQHFRTGLTANEIVVEK